MSVRMRVDPLFARRIKKTQAELERIFGRRVSEADVTKVFNNTIDQNVARIIITDARSKRRAFIRLRDTF